MKNYALAGAGSALLLCVLALLGSAVASPGVIAVTSTTDVVDGNTSSISSLQSNPGADGVISLREAINAAYNTPGSHTIEFDIPDSDSNYGLHTAGVWTIVISPTLAYLTSPQGDVVDGATQATNYGSDTNPYGPEIEISGELLDPGMTCWRIGTSSNTVKDLVVNRCGAYGIWIFGGDDNTLIGNYIGTDATGTADAGALYQGILLTSGASNNTIGGSSQADRNIISGNDGGGIRIATPSATGNVIMGNYIGTERGGTAPLANSSYGVKLHSGTHDNTVGPNNIIAYNGSHGVWVDGSGTTDNTVTQNSIYSNGGEGIHLTDGGNGSLGAPTVTSAWCTGGGGTSGPSLRIEVFADRNGQGRFYEGYVMSASGSFSFFPAGAIFRYPFVTLTATDAAGNTSEFSTSYPSGCLFRYLPLSIKRY